MKNLKYYLNKAQKEKWAIGQFNFSDFTQLKGIVETAKIMKSPIILGTSEGESNFFGLEEAVVIRDIMRKKTKLPIFLNLDHGKSFEYIKQAVNAGYDMVHFDGSKLSLEENIKITKEVVKYAKRKGVLVEGEIGKIGSDSSKVYTEKFEIKEENLTNPEQAKDYIDKTKVDLLAISVGTFHGIESSGLNPNLRLDVLEKISETLRRAQGKNSAEFLVLHGGSGTPEEDIKKAVDSGIVKININTELRSAFAENIKTALGTGEIVPYKFLSEAQKAVGKVVESKIKLFGSENRV
jgi:fructose-bisphosphate aldolase class II